MVWLLIIYLIGFALTLWIIMRTWNRDTNLNLGWTLAVCITWPFWWTVAIVKLSAREDRY